MRSILFTTLTVGLMASTWAQAPTPSPVTAPATARVAEGSQLAQVSDGTVSDADKAIRCRTVRVTGSLVKKGKVCKTVAQWRQISESGNDLARRMVEDGTSRPGGQ